MNSFADKLLRLKNELKIQDDKDIAEILGLGVKAFSARKVRDSFPEKELFALKAKRPELNLDIDYILLGTRKEVFEAIEQEMLKDMPKADFSDKTGLLVQWFLQSDDQGRLAILNVAKTMAETMPREKTTEESFPFENRKLHGIS